MPDCKKCKNAIWSFWVGNGESCLFVSECMKGLEEKNCDSYEVKEAVESD